MKDVRGVIQMLNLGEINVNSFGYIDHQFGCLFFIYRIPGQAKEKKTMAENKFIRLLHALEDAKLSTADCADLIEQRSVQMPEMEEKLRSMLQKPSEEREMITKKGRLESSEDVYELAGYDPITKTVFIRDLEYPSCLRAVEIERFIFHEYRVSTPDCSTQSTGL